MTEQMPRDSQLKRLYPEVAMFAIEMRKELWQNRNKGDRAGWLGMSLRECWAEIAWHNAKLAVAIKENDFEKIREYSADVANMAMMVDDILLVLADERDGE